MTANWFEAKVKYMKVNEDGREKKVNEAYLLDAMSYTEAESRIMHEMESVISGDYYISSLKKSNITELVPSEDENDDRWYYLVAASNINKAVENLEKSLASFVVPYEIASLTDTQFMDVFPYFSDEEEQIPENLKPLTEEKTEEEI